MPTLPPELWFRVISMLPRGKQDADASIMQNAFPFASPIQNTTL